MTAADLTSTLDRSGWQLGAAARAPRRSRALRDLQADWRRWSAGERVAALLMVALWTTAVLSLAAMSGA